mgnify:CR=1 FL=1
MTHLLDSSAFLAYFLGEPEGEHVRSLLVDENNSIAISVLSALELWARLKALNRDVSFEQEWELHSPLFDAILEVDWSIIERAIVIRRVTPQRLPTIDSLIAATASVHSLTLVHCDPHFRPVPLELLRQLDLEAQAP